LKATSIETNQPTQKQRMVRIHTLKDGKITEFQDEGHIGLSPAKSTTDSLDQFWETLNEIGDNPKEYWDNPKEFSDSPKKRQTFSCGGTLNGKEPTKPEQDDKIEEAKSPEQEVSIEAVRRARLARFMKKEKRGIHKKQIKKVV
jgi:hypothetical protein